MKLTVSQLRGLIKEELTAEPDPFAEPKGPRQAGSLSAEDIKKIGRVLAKIEDQLGPVPGMLTELTKLTRAPKAKSMFQKASGLGYHAMNDVRGMVAILDIFLRKVQSN